MSSVTIVRVNECNKYDDIENLKRVMTLKEMSLSIGSDTVNVVIEGLSKNEINEAELIAKTVSNMGGTVRYTSADGSTLSVGKKLYEENIEAEINETEINETELNETELNETEVNETELNETEVNETESNNEDSSDRDIITKESVDNNNISTEELDSIKREYNNKIKEYEQEFKNRIEEEERKHKKEIESLEEKHRIEVEKLKDEVDNANKKADNIINNTSENFDNLNDNYERLTSKYNELNNSFEKHKRESNNAYEELLNAKSLVDERLNAEVINRNIANEVIEEALINGEKQFEKVILLQNEIEEQKNEYEKKIEEINSAYNEEKTDIENKHNEEISNINNRSIEEKKQLESEIESLEEKISNYESSMKSLSDLDSKLIEYRDSNDTLKKEIDRYIKDNESKKAAIEDKDLTIEKLTDTIKNLNDRCAESNFSSIQYRGEAKIVSVAGMGSYGVTTIAHTVADKCKEKGKTIIVELDMDSMSLREWSKNENSVSDDTLELTRIINNKKIGLNKLSKTGMNFLVLRKSSFVRNNLDKVIVERNGLDYFIGCNLGLTDNEITEIEFEELLSILSEKYEFIILDLGKLGYSNFQTQYVRNFANISVQFILVGKDVKNWTDIKKAEEKINKLDIDKDKIVFINNFSNSNLRIDKTFFRELKSYINIKYNREMLEYTDIKNSDIDNLVGELYE